MVDCTDTYGKPCLQQVNGTRCQSLPGEFDETRASDEHKVIKNTELCRATPRVWTRKKGTLAQPREMLLQESTLRGTNIQLKQPALPLICTLCLSNISRTLFRASQKICRLLVRSAYPFQGKFSLDISSSDPVHSTMLLLRSLRDPNLSTQECNLGFGSFAMMHIENPTARIEDGSGAARRTQTVATL
jgi:hypothetical protein